MPGTTTKAKTARLAQTFRNGGFTIVELLIVIVVIGILVAIVIVAYTGITDSSKRASASSQVKQWSKLFELYRAQYGALPSLADGYYCLGTGFPSNECRQPGHATYGYDESTGTPIITELSKVGTVPSNAPVTVGPYASPYMQVTSTRYILFVLMPGNDDQACGKAGLTHSWLNAESTIVQCRLDILR